MFEAQSWVVSTAGMLVQGTILGFVVRLLWYKRPGKHVSMRSSTLMQSPLHASDARSHSFHRCDIVDKQ